MRAPSIVRWAGSPRAAVLGLVAAVLLGFLVLRFGGVILDHPVESVLVAILVCAVVTLFWACRELLRDASRRIDSILDEELGPRGRRDDRSR